MERTKYTLDEKEMPTHWYNIQADLPEPLPPLLNPVTKQPTRLPPPLFPDALNEQEFSKERWIEIPEEVQDIYRLWRPTPLFRAWRLEKALDTPAKIFYKYEGTSPAGSHKPNTAVAQAYYVKKEGFKRISTETGAGQWGSAMSMGAMFFGLECKVYMVRISYEQKPYRRILMETWGAKCVPSPSKDTQIGRDILTKDPTCSGSLGIAISEAVEDALARDDTKYCLGSVLNHVLLHQTIVGEETRKQMEKACAYPDIIVGCVGGGSNFAGQFLPWIRDKISGVKPDMRIICVEPTACPSLTKGPYAWDYGDVAGLAPIVKMYTLGHTFVPPPVHAGGLRYHGMAPIICHLYKLGLVEARAESQVGTFEAGVKFARTEGIISAPEPNHAIKVVIDEALKCRESGESKTILLAHSGHGHFDMAAYDAYLSGKLVDYEYPREMVEAALANLPKVD
ncbi:MAG: TrpB-like pyridoxal phosphate-dependent enzyme [Chloroflexi bacterium CG_4_9_14_3_um_filter_45_9]|nr:MAG: TrpB-like pyridoxal-phosphate dependent enzyme [Dehalococcoidia bacterium CG2_30_46_9]PIU23035.1 MAG: TrpB-like pyridoxal phosphate-dependent enzyme [Chloroflexi bacterium CG08_land_8_20_14_0_20_45_12]PIX26854.1 MAG: TrpB-like pyridoxal phosphate-dependent enzyme [Chloroflexi bacterium CG_4_8_14_3_um_filter_45_15]PJB49638.1 MAG: TrpB-like pyridoxal phosphate-dependent enzyme [Chloroflexi bacterium CG_4_9_14_3_um_filter_45_9]